MKEESSFTPEQVTRANKVFHDSIAHDYDKRLELYHPLVLEHYRDLFYDKIFSHFVETGEKLSILDVGCGTGYIEQFLVKRNVDVEGINVSTKMLAHAQAKFPKSQYPSFRFRETDVYKLGQERYEIVLANSFLHHLKDYELVLRNMAEKVKPGGVLFIGMEPNRFVYKYLFFIISMFRWLIPHRKTFQETESSDEKLAEYHIFYGSGVSPRALKKQLKNLGFSRIKFIYSGRQTLAKVQDEVGINLFPFFPRFILDHLGPFAQLFHVVAYKD